MTLADTLLARIRHYLQDERGIEPLTVQRDVPFRELGLDSLDLVEMAIDWEDDFGVRIEDDHIAEIVTFGDAIDFVCDHGRFAVAA